MPIVLYNVEGSPPCFFIRSLAKEIGLSLTLKNITLKNGDHLTEEFQKLNPFHKVPTIDDDGFVVYESNAIAYYLLRKYAPACELYPDCIETRTQIDQVLAAVSVNIQPHAAAFFRPCLLQQSKPTFEEELTFEVNVIKGLEHLIGEAKYAIGDQYTIADLCLIGEILVALENGSVDKNNFPKLTSYYERLKAELPYFEEIYAPNIEAIKRMWSELN
uniref:Glutathione S-transferase Epsilon 2 n=1 Tax=Dermacentor marginatus TaxID=49202 RepID=A0A889IW32_DERMR|nr:glutathione S-transferase Epsilon 2 [Dermacentor marginatus]